MSVAWTHFESPVGRLMLASEQAAGLRQINFPQNGHPAVPDPDWQEDPPALREAISQLRAYFSGELESFDLPLAPVNTKC